MAISKLTVITIQNNKNNLLYEAFEKYGRWSWWLSVKHPDDAFKDKLLLRSDFLYGSKKEALSEAQNIVEEILKYDILKDSPDNKEKVERERAKQEDLEKEKEEREKFAKKPSK